MITDLTMHNRPKLFSTRYRWDFGCLLSVVPYHFRGHLEELTYATDTGEQKKTLTMGLGAEKWIDFRETNDLVADVMAATDGAGPHAAIVATSTVSPGFQIVGYHPLTRF
jgi:hypothetical protein